MILEPKPLTSKEEEPHLCYEGRFISSRKVQIVTPPVGTVQGDSLVANQVVGSENENHPFATGELRIDNDGGHWLKLDDQYAFCGADSVKSSERRICGRIGKGSAAVLLVDCRNHTPWKSLLSLGGDPHLVLPGQCLIQKGQWFHRPRGRSGHVFSEFEENEPIEFDKVRFVLDGLSEFTGDAFSAVHKFSSFKDDPKMLVDLAEFAQHGFARQQSKTKTWNEPPPLKLRLKTQGGDIDFCIERKGGISKGSHRGWETFCTMEFPEMLPLEEIIKMIVMVKSFFDFLFQCSLALRSVWVYSSKQVITDVNFGDRLIYTDEEDDLTSVPVPVCWRLYFKWPEGFQEENRDSYYGIVKIGFGDFAENNKSLLGEYLSKFIDVLFHRSDETLADFINFWIHNTYITNQPLRTALSVHFPALEYFAQKKEIEKRAYTVKQWMKSLAEPLGGDYLKFAERFAKYRNKHAVHHDPDEDFPWSSEDEQQGYQRLRVLMRFHILNLLQPDHEELNKTLSEKIWTPSWR